MDEIAPVARSLPRLAAQNYASGDSDEEESSNNSSDVDRHPILQFVQGPHRTTVDASQLDEDHGAVAEDEPLYIFASGHGATKIKKNVLIYCISCFLRDTHVYAICVSQKPRCRALGYATRLRNIRLK